MATLIKSDGQTLRVKPKNGKNFRLAELRELLNCYFVELVHLADGRIMIIDEKGKLSDNHDVNLPATLLFREDRMDFNQMNQYMRSLEKSGVSVIDIREVKGEDYIAGDALVCRDEEFL